MRIDHIMGLCYRAATLVFPDGMSCMEEREEVLLTSREAAEILDLSPDTVNEFARKQVLPAIKKGRQWRFRRRDITSFKRYLSKSPDRDRHPQQRGRAAA